MSGPGVHGYTPEALANLWTATYRFSQGLPDLQKTIISYVCREALPPSVVEDEELRAASFELAKDKVFAITNSGAHTASDIPMTRVESEFKSDVEDTVETPQPWEIEDLARRTVKQTLMRDATYLPANKYDRFGRTFGTADGRYYSYAVRYIMLGATTGQPAIDQCFGEARLQLPTVAAEPIRTVTDRSHDGLHAVPRNTFTFGQVAAQHIEDNPDDAEAIQAAAVELEMVELLA
jgi:hypothetical protein